MHAACGAWTKQLIIMFLSRHFFANCGLPYYVGGVTNSEKIAGADPVAYA